MTEQVLLNSFKGLESSFFLYMSSPESFLSHTTEYHNKDEQMHGFGKLAMSVSDRSYQGSSRFTKGLEKSCSLLLRTHTVGHRRSQHCKKVEMPKAFSVFTGDDNKETKSALLDKDCFPAKMTQN